MARFEINTDNMRAAASNFESKINDWNGLTDRIWGYMSDLDSMWDGDANEAFNSLIEEDKPKFQNLVEVMRSYKDEIVNASTRYDETENEVKNIVSRR